MDPMEYTVYGFLQDEVGGLREVCQTLEETVEELTENNIRLVDRVENLEKQVRELKRLAKLKGYGDEAR